MCLLRLRSRRADEAGEALLRLGNDLLVIDGANHMMLGGQTLSMRANAPSPAMVAPPPPLPVVISPTPPSDTAKPNQATGRATARYHTAAMIATSTGTAPISRAAWVTLVRPMPAFCTMTEPP